MTTNTAPPPPEPTAGVDWSDAHRRLHAAEQALERGWTPSSEARRAILKERAKALAREPEPAEPQAALDILAFRLAHETYGVETAFVREVYPLKDYTPVPGAPPFVLGIVNVRRQILSVIDVKKFFDLPEEGLTDLNKVIIVQHDKMELGILADAILSVQTVPLAAIQPGLPTLTGLRAEYLRGVTPERMVILDAARILSDPKIVVQEQ